MGIYLPGAGPLGFAAKAWDRLLRRYLSCPFGSPCCLQHRLSAPPHLYTRPCESAPICESTHLDECVFFKSLIVGLPYSSISWWFWVLIVLRSGCNSLYGCKRRWSVSAYASTLTRSPCVLFYTSAEVRAAGIMPSFPCCFTYFVISMLLCIVWFFYS